MCGPFSFNQLSYVLVYRFLAIVSIVFNTIYLNGRNYVCMWSVKLTWLNYRLLNPLVKNFTSIHCGHHYCSLQNSTAWWLLLFSTRWSGSSSIFTEATQPTNPLSYDSGKPAGKWRAPPEISFTLWIREAETKQQFYLTWFVSEEMGGPKRVPSHK